MKGLSYFDHNCHTSTTLSMTVVVYPELVEGLSMTGLSRVTLSEVEGDTDFFYRTN